MAYYSNQLFFECFELDNLRCRVMKSLVQLRYFIIASQGWVQLHAGAKFESVGENVLHSAGNVLGKVASHKDCDGNIDDGVTTLFFEAESTEEMYAWILAIRRELILRDREAVPSSQTGGGDNGSSVLISESSGLAFRHYSLEHRELLCDDCVAAGRTPKGFAVMPDQLQPIGDAARDAARRASHVLDTSYDLRDIFVSSSESMLKSSEESKQRSMQSVRHLVEEVGTSG